MARQARPQPLGTTVRGTDIVADALSYRGRWTYVFGGAPGPLAGDCSRFGGCVLGRDLGLAIPGFPAGTFDGSSHGPVVMQYATWSGAVTLPAGMRPIPGDLCIWAGVGASGHMGFATGPHEMVSALNQELGVLQTGIEGNGPAGTPLMFRRIVNLAGQGPLPAGSGVPQVSEVVLLLAGAAVFPAVIAIAGTLAILGLSALAAAGITAVAASRSRQ